MKIFFIFLFFNFSMQVFAQEDTTVKTVAYPDNYVAQLNVVYVTVDDWQGKMDLYVATKEQKPTPIVINIHGGGWNHGDKSSQTGFNSFFKSGYAVANVEYRLTQQASAPAAIEDVRCALIYIIKNAKTLNIDPNKIVVMGSSSGGHLALMAGLLQNDRRFDNNCEETDSVKVAAIIDKYGIADVWDWGYGPGKSKSAVNWLGNFSKDKGFAAAVSPITYVSSDSPPTFIVHGDADPTVPYRQSEALHKKFLEAGVKTEFITVTGGLHGKFPAEKNAEINKAIMNFLTQLGITGN